MARLVPFAEDIWTADAPQAFHGLEFGTRMTVVRLPDGRLWLHSPIPIDAALADELRSLGEVGAIVAPNRLHHLYVAPCQELFPGAKTHLAPRLSEKRPDLRFDDELTGDPPSDWGAALSARLIDGIPRFREVLFLHHASRTLIATDAIFHVRGVSSRLTRALAFLLRRSGPSGLFNDPLFRLVMDRDLVRASMQDVARWDFDRIVLAHGANIPSDGKAHFERIYGAM